jgi:predicted DCC family thiol-disulfide oxidoreductase YuxK
MFININEMLRPEAHAPPPTAGAHLVLYDGVCGLCSRLLRFLLRRDRRRVFSFASLQSDVGQSIVERSGANPGELTSFYVVADYRTGAPRLFTKGDAALFVAGALGWPWRLALLMHVVPRFIRDRLYDVVARNRYRLFGRFDRCLVPTPEFKSRFVD